MAFLSKIFKSGVTEKAAREKAAAPEHAATDEKRAEVLDSGAKTIRAYGVIRAPRLTEKSAAAAAHRAYAFVVSPGVNKIEVRRAVEERYGVHVEAVRVLNLPAKKYARGRITGWKPGVRKAMVTLREGEKIEIQ